MSRQLASVSSMFISQQGFSIIEAMIAVAIFSIGVLAVIAMQVSTISGNGGARKISDTLVMAEDQLENIMALPYGDAQLDPGLHQIDAGGYSMVWTVAMADLNNDGANDAKRILLSVNHQGDATKGATIQHLIPEP